MKQLSEKQIKSFDSWSDEKLKKFSKFFPIGGILFLIIGIILLFCVPVLGIIFITLSIYAAYYAPKTFNQVLQYRNQVKGQMKKETIVPESEKNYNLFDDVVDGSILVYEYENNICLDDGAVEFISGKGGKHVEFVQEPDNAYDNKAVAVYLENQKVGYIYRGQTQDMVNDWIKKNQHFEGYINKIDVTANKVTYKIGFYKPLDAFEHKSYSLVKISKKCDEFELNSRFENLEFMNEDDDLIIEYNGHTDSYIVYSDTYSEIGELPKSFGNYISDKSYSKLVGKLIEVETFDSVKAKVEVYIIK